MSNTKSNIFHMVYKQQIMNFLTKKNLNDKRMNQNFLMKRANTSIHNTKMLEMLMTNQRGLDLFQ